MKALRATDRFEVKHEGVTVIIAPLPYRERIDLSLSATAQSSLKDKVNYTAALFKKCVKEVKGVKDFHDNEYSIEMENDQLTEQSVDELLDLLGSNEAICGAISHGGMAEVELLQQIEGVELTFLGKSSPK